MRGDHTDTQVWQQSNGGEIMPEMSHLNASPARRWDVGVRARISEQAGELSSAMSSGRGVGLAGAAQMLRGPTQVASGPRWPRVGVGCRCLKWRMRGGMWLAVFPGSSSTAPRPFASVDLRGVCGAGTKTPSYRHSEAVV